MCGSQTTVYWNWRVWFSDHSIYKDIPVFMVFKGIVTDGLRRVSTV